MRRWATTILLLTLASAPAPATASSAGERHQVRQAPGTDDSAGRHERRRSLAFFAHLTDLHIADEAPPARHEQLYGRGPVSSPGSGARRRPSDRTWSTGRCGP